MIISFVWSMSPTQYYARSYLSVCRQSGRRGIVIRGPTASKTNVFFMINKINLTTMINHHHISILSIWSSAIPKNTIQLLYSIKVRCCLLWYTLYMRQTHRSIGERTIVNDYSLEEKMVKMTLGPIGHPVLQWTGSQPVFLCAKMH